VVHVSLESEQDTQIPHDNSWQVGNNSLSDHINQRCLMLIEALLLPDFIHDLLVANLLLTSRLTFQFLFSLFEGFKEVVLSLSSRDECVLELKESE
jgi:hypothetical protein